MVSYPLKRPAGQFLVPSHLYNASLHRLWTAGAHIRSLIPNQRGKDIKKKGVVIGTMRTTSVGVLPWKALIVQWEGESDNKKTPALGRANPWEVESKCTTVYHALLRSRARWCVCVCVGGWVVVLCDLSVRLWLELHFTASRGFLVVVCGLVWLFLGARHHHGSHTQRPVS